MATRTVAALMAAALLAACTAPSQPMLDRARATCANGNTSGCAQIPYLETVVNREKSEQAREVAAGFAAVLGAAALGAAAGYAASQPSYYYYTPVVVCRRWYC
jgi:hypothetical protein